MRIFIDHQQADTVLAASIAKRLWCSTRSTRISTFIDPETSRKGDQLGEHIRDELGKCDQLLAVVSDATKRSWWVPWEIGVATEKDYPIATYAGDKTPLPEYLTKWPYLKSYQELDIYARVSKQAHQTYTNNKRALTEPVARKTARWVYNRLLPARLGQG